MTASTPQLKKDISKMVAIALEEDIGSGDITAALIPASQTARARVTTREDCVIAGTAWVEEVFAQLDRHTGSTSRLDWRVGDGASASADSTLLELSGNARTLLSGERTALNFLQLLSGVATTSSRYAKMVKHTGVQLLDTRKTLPGLRTAQKYAVTCGGCYNHRTGLFDAFLIKENHIAACGGITRAIATARDNHPDKPVEVEVENLRQLKTALAARADIVMLDNFTLEELQQGVQLNQAQGKARARLEASGGITRKTLVGIAETGVDAISIGSLTKDCRAVDLSMGIFIPE